MTIAAPPRPYKGLVPFEDAELDALLFFGRERESEIIVANLLASRLTVLYGPSGVGKTSLLRAGVAQRLRSLPDAEVGVFSSWAEDPTAEIDDLIAAAGDVDLYLILDQIEEYFVYHGGDAPFARRLPEIVLEAGRVNVLLGIREDALAKLDFFKGRIPNLFSNYLRLDHLDRAAARQAVVGPLQRLNELWPGSEPYRAEPELVEALLDQVATGRIEYGLSGRGIVKGRDEPPRIEAPFLQLVLERLWEVEEAEGSNVLRLGTLERLGGADTIVREHLERALESLDPRQQELAAEIFDHLVTPSGTKIAHAVGDLAGYASASREELGDVLARLSNERIVRRVDDASADGRFEIFHDVLAGGVLAWRAAFDAERELEQERRRRRRAVFVAGVALVALAAVAAAALYALSLRDRAEEQARNARAREFSARALSDLTVDPERSLRFAVAAAEHERTPQVESVLRQSLLMARERLQLPAERDAPVVAFDGRGRVVVPAGGAVRAYTRDGSFERLPGLRSTGLAALSEDRRYALEVAGRRATVRDVGNGRVVRRLRTPGAIRSGRFDASGRFIALVAADATRRVYAHVYELASGRRIRVFRHRGTTSVAFSPDGRLLATGSADDSARIWRLRDGRLLHALTDHSGDVLAVEFSPEGTKLATASADSGVRVWHVADGTREFFFLGHTDRVVALAWSPDGDALADGSLDRTSRIYDTGGISAGRMAGWQIGHDGGIMAVAYSTDGRTLATVSDDGTARLWEGRIEHELRPLSQQQPGPTRATVDAEGRRAVSAGVDGAAVVDLDLGRRTAWIEQSAGVSVARFDPSGSRLVIGGPRDAAMYSVAGRRLAALAHRGAVNDAVFSADGLRIVTAGADGWARVFQTDGTMVAHLNHPGPVRRVAISADGRIATATADGALRLWRPGSSAAVISGHQGDVTALRFSSDGQWLLSGGSDGVARVWNADTGALRFELGGHNGGVGDAVFNPNGRRIVTTSLSRQVRMWDGQTGNLIRELIGHFAPVNSAAFSGDGRWLVTTSALAVGLWQTNAGQPFAYLRGHRAPPVRSAEFTPDAREVVTAGDDGTVRIYDCDLCGGIDDLLAIARARLARLRPAG